METNTEAFIQIGSITACIAGDHRYSSTIRVEVSGEDARVLLLENGAVGGMDGDGRSHGFSETKRMLCKATARDIVKTVKAMMNAEVGTVVKTYGKPSKNFWWVGIKERGLSVKNAALALEY